MKIGVVFSGQGAQYVGMGKKLYDRYYCVRNIFHNANDVLGYDLRKMCFYGDGNELRQSQYTQPAVFTVSYAAYKAYIDEYGIEPYCVAGHSMGEITALVCANVMDFSQGLDLIRKRGIIMQNSIANVGGMYAIINFEKSELERECLNVSDNSDYAVISNYNSANQYTISGSFSALDRVIPQIKEKGGICIPLKVSGPFHSKYMLKSAEEFRNVLSKYEFDIPNCMVMLNYSGKKFDSNMDLKEILVKQIYSPVYWNSCVNSMMEKGVEVILEAGPKNTLTKMIREQTNEIKIFSSDSEKELKEFYESIESNDDTYIGEKYVSDEARMNELVRECLRTAVCIQNNGDDNLEYENEFQIPYSKTKAKYLTIKEKGENTLKELAQMAIDVLKAACKVKRVGEAEKEGIYKELIRRTGTKNLMLDLLKD